MKSIHNGESWQFSLKKTKGPRLFIFERIFGEQFKPIPEIKALKLYVKGREKIIAEMIIVKNETINFNPNPNI